jgi:predicted nucleotidyltransferase component of viral defense system
MNMLLPSLLKGYNLSTAQNWEHALREVLQHLALLGLWRAKFFEHAAFYGGTALRIFHGLDRFSEDLDFTLTTPDPGFTMKGYLGVISAELSAFGFDVTVEPRQKKTETNIDSAFIKADTLRNLVRISAPRELLGELHREQRISIRLEIDIAPPPGAGFEVKTVLVPMPFQVRLVSLPDLFAGKAHALLCRQWKSRVKGRDFYDFVWFVAQGAPCHIEHLKARMVQTGHWDAAISFQEDDFRRLLKEKFSKVDFTQAQNDVRSFIRDQDSLKLWNREFFNGLVTKVKTC